jgi:hypothetical protein
MDARAQYIKQRLSLREPLKESLDIVSDVTAKLSLKKEANLAEELKKISEAYPKCIHLFLYSIGCWKNKTNGCMHSLLILGKRHT